MTDPEERIVEIEERAERGWYMPSDVAYLLEVARAARELMGLWWNEAIYVEESDVGAEFHNRLDRLRDALHDGGDDGGK